MGIYHIYGLNIQSEVEFQNLKELFNCDSIDVKILIAAMPNEILQQKEKGYHQGIFSNKRCWLHFLNVGDFLIENGTSITFQMEENVEVDIEDVRICLLGPCFGEILFQRDVIALHGSALEYKEGAIVISGKPGSGKSTTTRELLNRNYNFMSDDIVAIKNEYNVSFACPAYPMQKLCADAATKNGMKLNDLQLIKDDREKYAVEVNENYIDKEIKLKVLVVLETKQQDELIVQEITGNNKLQYVINNLFNYGKYQLMSMEPDVFRQCIAIANNVRVVYIQRPKNVYTILEIADCIQNYTGV